MPLDLDIFGQGIYSPRQAARLIGGTPQEVRRWTRGSGPTEPLWKNHYSALDDSADVSFFDLIELRLVRAFRKSGVSMQAIRFAIDFAREKYQKAHPFTSLSFKTDGGEILMEAVEKDGELISLAKKTPGQKVFRRIIEQSLNDLEYENDQVSIWRPSGSKHIVIDPDRSFGTPIIDRYGISSKMLFDEHRNGLGKKYLSRIYDIPEKLVSDALQYEERLEKRQSEIHGQSSV